MKKILVTILTLALLTSAVACSQKKDSGKVTIGLIQYIQHAALDKATEGFKAALKDNGYIEGENLVYDDQNAGGEEANCVTIADKFVNEKVDLIFANATPAAQAVANKTTEIPVVITSVTDPESAGLVDTNSNPGGNITGTSDLTPVENQLDLLVQLLPNAKKVAVMYCGAEDNSIFQAKIAMNYLKKLGLTGQETTVSDSNSIQQVVESLIGKVDAIYIPTDNLLASGMATVTLVANKNNLPVIVGESGMVSNGGLATYGIDYYNLGYKTGEMAVKILKGESKPADMAIEYLPAEDCELVVNTTSAKTLGLTIPEDILAKAKTVE